MYQKLMKKSRLWLVISLACFISNCSTYVAKAIPPEPDICIVNAGSGYLDCGSKQILPTEANDYVCMSHPDFQAMVEYYRDSSCH